MENEIQKPGPRLVGTFQKNDQGEIHWVNDPNGKFLLINPNEGKSFAKYIDSFDNTEYDKFGQPNQ